MLVRTHFDDDSILIEHSADVIIVADLSFMLALMASRNTKEAMAIVQAGDVSMVFCSSSKVIITVSSHHYYQL